MMENKMEKRAEKAKKRENRMEQLYELEGYESYAAVCPDHPGVRRGTIPQEEREKLGYGSNQIVWKCPIDNKVYAAEGGIENQGKGGSSKNNTRPNSAPIQDDMFEPVNDMRRIMQVGE